MEKNGTDNGDNKWKFRFVLLPLIKELREWGKFYFGYTNQPNPCNSSKD